MEDSNHSMSKSSPRKALEEILNNHKSINGKSIAEKFDLEIEEGESHTLFELWAKGEIFSPPIIPESMYKDINWHF